MLRFLLASATVWFQRASEKLDVYTQRLPWSCEVWELISLRSARCPAGLVWPQHHTHPSHPPPDARSVHRHAHMGKSQPCLGEEEDKPPPRGTASPPCPAVGVRQAPGGSTLLLPHSVPAGDALRGCRQCLARPSPRPRCAHTATHTHTARCWQPARTELPAAQATSPAGQSHHQDPTAVHLRAWRPLRLRCHLAWASGAGWGASSPRGLPGCPQCHPCSCPSPRPKQGTRQESPRGAQGR